MNAPTTSERRITDTVQNITIGRQHTESCPIVMSISWYKDGIWKINCDSEHDVLRLSFEKSLSVPWYRPGLVDTIIPKEERLEIMLESASGLSMRVNSKTNVLEGIYVMA